MISTMMLHWQFAFILQQIFDKKIKYRILFLVYTFFNLHFVCKLNVFMRNIFSWCALRVCKQERSKKFLKRRLNKINTSMLLFLFTSLQRLSFCCLTGVFTSKKEVRIKTCIFVVAPNWVSILLPTCIYLRVLYSHEKLSIINGILKERRFVE